MPESSPKRDFVRVEHLTKFFPIESALMKKQRGLVRAVDDVSFSIPEGTTLGMVGESGCGKSTIGKTILRAYEPTSGKIFINLDGKEIDVSAMSMKQLRQIGFRKNTQMVFQDPNSSLDPHLNVMEIIAEPIRANLNMREKQLREHVLSLMEKVGLDKR